MVCLQLQQLHRLNTYEDRIYFHAHKVLGLLALGNFFYRIYLWISYGGMMLESKNTPYWLLIHTALHLTSFQFHLSLKKNKAYNIIWPEMRWHAMIFAYRSIVAVLLQWLTEWDYIPSVVNDLLRGPLVLLTIVLADIVTNYYKVHGTIDSTTMRGNPYPSWVPPWYIKHHNLFYSVSQVLGTLNILTERDMGKLFIILFPIQTAPFCMTLCKKGIMDQFAWHLYYTVALLLNYAYGASIDNMSSITPVWFYWGVAVIFVVARFQFNCNKYMLWGSIVSASMLFQLTQSTHASCSALYSQPHSQ